MIEILRPGPLALVEDRGRVGLAALGVGRSGAADRAALDHANRLVGNPEDAAGLEVALGPFEARFRDAVWFALAGGWGPATLDGVRIEPGSAVHAAAGAQLRLEAPLRGLRRYLAVRGGLRTEVLLGSRSVDVLAGLGAPCAAGDRLPVGPEPERPVPADDGAGIAGPDAAEDADPVVVHAHPGPRADWFTAEARELFYDTDWAVTPRCDRVGLALEPASPGPSLDRAHHGELPSEAMVPGAVQVTHAGAPTVLFVDHPVTGGYPVIAVVADADLDTLGRLAPGRRLRFRHPAHRLSP